MPNGITIDTAELRATLREYMKYTKRDLATVLNTMGFYIARAAIRNTKKVSSARIKSELQKLLRPEGSTDLGKFFESQYPQLAARYKQSRTVRIGNRDVPLVALLINAKRGKSGQKGLQGQDMQSAADRFIASRAKSAAFIASGFLPSVRAFEPYAIRKSAAAPKSPEVMEHGAPKGYGTVAREDTTVARAVISNMAQSRDDGGRGLEAFGGRGLQSAVDEEVRGKQRVIEERLQETANKFNAR